MDIGQPMTARIAAYVQLTNRRWSNTRLRERTSAKSFPKHTTIVESMVGLEAVDGDGRVRIHGLNGLISNNGDGGTGRGVKLAAC